MNAAQYRELTRTSAPNKPLGIWTAQAPADGVVMLKKTRKPNRQAEESMQIALFRWFALQYPEYAGHFFAVPNGGQRSKATAAKIKAAGALAGVSDCILAINRPHAPALFLELKHGKNKPSEAQALFLSRMQAQGYTTAVAYDFHAARAAIVNHIGY